MRHYIRAGVIEALVAQKIYGNMSEFIRRVDVPRSNVYRFLHKQSEPSVRFLLGAEKVLGVDLHTFLEEQV